MPPVDKISKPQHQQLCIRPSKDKPEPVGQTSTALKVTVSPVNKLLAALIFAYQTAYANAQTTPIPNDLKKNWDENFYIISGALGFFALGFLVIHIACFAYNRQGYAKQKLQIASLENQVSRLRAFLPERGEIERVVRPEAPPPYEAPPSINHAEVGETILTNLLSQCAIAEAYISVHSSASDRSSISTISHTSMSEAQNTDTTTAL